VECALPLPYALTPSPVALQRHGESRVAPSGPRLRGSGATLSDNRIRQTARGEPGGLWRCFHTRKNNFLTIARPSRPVKRLTLCARKHGSGPFSLIPLEDFYQLQEGEKTGCPNPVHLVNVVTGRWRCVPCKKRRCEWCGERIWKKYVQAGMMAGLRGQPYSRLLMLTLTAPGGALDVEAWNQGASRMWSSFLLALRKKFGGTSLSYWKVGELQKRGAIHYHVLLRGLVFLPVELLRSLAMASGFGSWVWVGRPDVRKGGMQGLLGYFGKYLTKGMTMWQSVQHVVTHSHDWRVEWRQHRAVVGRLTDWQWIPSASRAYRLLKLLPAPDGLSLARGPT